MYHVCAKEALVMSLYRKFVLHWGDWDGEGTELPNLSSAIEMMNVT
jgi:hypothetical protein